MNHDLAVKVKLRLALVGKSPIQAAESVGLERSFFKDLLSGKKKSFSRRFDEKVAKALHLQDVDELHSPQRVNYSRKFDVDHQTTTVPEMAVTDGASYAAGIGDEENIVDRSTKAATRDAIRTRWGIPLPFLRDELRLHPGRVHIIPVRGDSMMDSLYDGDRVGIDLDDTDVSQGGIFALIDDVGSLVIKQVELIRGRGEARSIVCKSRNPKYEPFPLEITDPVRILGRVAFRITRF